MFESLRIFEVREPIVETYVVPALDTVGAGQVILPPDAPVILSIDTDELWDYEGYDYGPNPGLVWTLVPGASSYRVEYLASGTLWQVLATVSAPSPVQIIWSGVEWEIQLQENGVWTTLYTGPQPPVPGVIVGDTAQPQTILTPNLIPTWYLPGDVTPVPGLLVQLGSDLDPYGMTIVGAPNSSVNVQLAMPGPQNGRNSYLGPETYYYDFEPAESVFYRVRGINSAGLGPPSNVVQIYLPSVYAAYYQLTAVVSNPSTNQAKNQTQISLSWKQVPTTSSYYVYRSTTASFTPGPSNLLATVSGLSYIDTTADIGSQINPSLPTFTGIGGFYYQVIPVTGSYKNIIQSGYVSTLIPVMTSNTTPSGTANGGNFLFGFLDANSYRIFGGGQDSPDYDPAQTPAPFVSYEFPSATVVNAYTKTGRPEQNGGGESWVFQGSNDGQNWVTLDTQTNVYQPVDGTSPIYNFQNTIAYLYYQILSTSGPATEYNMGLVQMFFQSQATD